MRLRNIILTLLCVAIAGSLFIIGVTYDIRPLFLIGALIDWLPLLTGWMRLRQKNPYARTAGIIHGIITLIAYAIGVAWFTGIDLIEVRLSFLIVWFYAVLAGAAATAYAAHPAEA